MDKIKLRNATLLLGSTLTVLAGAIIAPALPAMANAFEGVPDAEFLVKLVLTIPALSIAIGAPFAGYLLDRVGRKPVIVGSLLLYGIAGVAGFFLTDIYTILMSRVILGIAVAGIMAGFTTLIVDYFSGAQLNKFMGYQGAAMGLGGMVFLLLAGYLTDIGWQWPFLIYGLGLLIIPGVLISITEPIRERGIAFNPVTPDKTSLPMKKIAFIYGSAFIGMLVFFVIILNLPFYLIEVGNVSNSEVGLVLAAQALIAVIFAIQYQKIKARLSFKTIFSIIFLTFGIGLLITSVTADYTLILLAMLIGGIGLGVMPPNLNVWISTVATPSNRGKVIGGLTSALFLGQFFTPIVTEPLIQNLGFAQTFGIAGLFSLVLAAGFFVAGMKHKAATPTQA